jgi:molybdopterin-guanine dinucleotide biosynthesis protein A
MLTGIQAAINAVKQTTPVPILVDTQPATILITGITAAINAVKQTTILVITVNTLT